MPDSVVFIHVDGRHTRKEQGSIPLGDAHAETS